MTNELLKAVTRIKYTKNILENYKGAFAVEIAIESLDDAVQWLENILLEA